MSKMRSKNERGCEEMNTCIHHDETHTKCLIFPVDCENPNHELKGCFISEQERDKMLGDIR